jgi:ADP-ribosylglycohydrolase
MFAHLLGALDAQPNVAVEVTHTHKRLQHTAAVLATLVVLL